FLDDSPAALAAVERNLASLGGLGAAMVRQADCLAPPRAQEPCGIVLLDPPYGEGLAAPALAALAAAGWIADGALCVVELSRDEAFDPPNGFAPLDDRRYGKARVVILRRNAHGLPGQAG
ncbi:MAG: RsmD family RNA methyltransferase, partial [Alphaproteobacteria bacterium]